MVLCTFHIIKFYCGIRLHLRVALKYKLHWGCIYKFFKECNHSSKLNLRMEHGLMLDCTFHIIKVFTLVSGCIWGLHLNINTGVAFINPLFKVEFQDVIIVLCMNAVWFQSFTGACGIKCFINSLHFNIYTLRV